MESVLKSYKEDKQSRQPLRLPKPNITMPKDVSAFKKGTTTLSMKVKDALVLTVDSRATQGDYISTQSVTKYIPITSNIVGTIAGTAADCQYWLRVLGKECRLYELRNNCKISVAAASQLLASMLYEYRDMDLGTYSMICGYDESGPHIYSIEAGGSRVEMNMFSLGSGSMFALSIADREYRYDMTTEEAVDLGRRAVFHATHRDCGSGGIISVVVIDKDGWRCVSRDDNTDLYYGKYQFEQDKAMEEE